MKQLNDRTKGLLRETKDFIAVNDFLAAYDYYFEPDLDQVQTDLEKVEFEVV